MQRYQQRGVSSSKEEVHQAISHLDAGLFPSAFCKVVPDLLTGNPEFCLIMHADGAGTKSSLAYLAYREKNDPDLFKGIAQDSIVMNLDDMLCAGATGPFMMSGTIGRNSKLVPGEVLAALINGNEEFCQSLRQYGVEIQLTGGETADLGDLVRTVVVDTTLMARLPRKHVIDNRNIQPGDLIIGLSSSGQTHWETSPNSGIGSNGLTSARHDLLHYKYAELYPESCDPKIPETLRYCGPHFLEDNLEGSDMSIGEALLSPTRTYAPLLVPLLKQHRDLIHGMVHCSGGGQTKCLKFGQGIHYIKDDLFDIPPVFKAIQTVSNTPSQEMYQVFNMGHRLELYGSEELLSAVRQLADPLGLEVKRVGHCKASAENNKLSIQTKSGTFEYP